MRAGLIATLLALAASAAGSAGAQTPAIGAVRQPHCIGAGAAIEITGEGLPASAYLAPVNDRRRATHLTTRLHNPQNMRLEAPSGARLAGDAAFALWLDGADRPIRIVETCRVYEPRAGGGPRFSIGIGGGVFGGGGSNARSGRQQQQPGARGGQRTSSSSESSAGLGLGFQIPGFQIPLGGGAARPDDRSRRADSDGDGVIDNEVVAYYGAASDAAQGAMLAASLGYVVVSDAPLAALGGVMVTYRTTDGAAEAAARLRALDPRGLYDANSVLYPAQSAANNRAANNRAASNRSQGRTYWPQMLRWRRADTCRPVLPIGIIDTVVDTEHRALAGAQITQAIFLKDGEAHANPRHGTAVAGLLVGGDAGAGLFNSGRLYVASAAEQSSARQLPFVRIDRAIAALDWLASQNVRLVNISLAGANNAVLARAVRAAAANGMVIVAAAGNGGAGAPPAFPAAYEETIAVTAIGADRSLYERANRGAYIDVAAPGVDIWAAGDRGGMWYFTGTSAAAPFVTARVAAERLPAGPEAAQRVRAQLRRNAVDLGSIGVDTHFGAGLINAPSSCR